MPIEFIEVFMNSYYCVFMSVKALIEIVSRFMVYRFYVELCVTYGILKNQQHHIR